MDPIVESLLHKYKARSKLGIKKYGHTLERDDLDLGDWLNHLQEELMDASLYIERLKRDIAILPAEVLDRLRVQQVHNGVQRKQNDTQ